MLPLQVILLVALGTLIIAATVSVIAAERKNGKRTTCKCCGCPLDKPGGHGNAWAGRGLCVTCNIEILREVNKRD